MYMKSRRIVRRLPLAQECAIAVALSGDGAFVATAADGCCRPTGVQVWDAQTGSLIREVPSAAIVRHLVFGGGTRWLAIVDDDGTARVLDWQSNRVSRMFTGLDMVCLREP